MMKRWLRIGLLSATVVFGGWGGADLAEAAELPAASDVKYENSSSENGAFWGTIRFKPAKDAPDITDYAVYFLNDDGEKLVHIGDVNVAKAEEDIAYAQSLGLNLSKGYYQITLQREEAIEIPSGASWVGVFSKKGTEVSDEATKAYVWDKGIVTNAKFTDTNAKRGAVEGTLTWSLAPNHPEVGAFLVRYYDGETHYEFPSPYGRVEVGDGGSYKIPIKAGMLPAMTSSIYIQPLLDEGSEDAGPGASVSVMDDISGETSGPSVATSGVPTPEDIGFKDQDKGAGTMGGYFTWTAEDTEFMEKEYSSGYTPFSYSLYFLDSKEKKLKGIYSIPRDYYKYGYYNVVLPSGIAVPPGAAYIGVFLELPSATGVEYAKIEFRDETGKDYYAQHATFVDADPKPGVVRGTVTWSASKDEGDLSGYALFAGEESAPFATIPVGKAYSVAVPDYVVDSGFRTVTVLPVDKNGAYLRSTSYRDARVQISDNRLAESLERPGKLSRSAYMYGSGMIKDEDPRPGYLGGSVQTGSSVAEGTAEWYFYDYMGERLAPIGSVAFEIEPNRVPVRFTIPAGTPIPKGAIYVGASVPRPDGTREETGIMIYDDASASSVAFSDIASSDSVGVDRLAALGIVNGYQDGTYRPDVTVTRAQFAAMLVRTFQLPSKPYGGEFTDVVSADWFASATASATDAGLLQGYEDGTFRPNQTITNKEMFAMVNRVFLWRTEEARVDENGLNNLRERFADWNEVPEWLYPALLKLEWYDLLPTDGKLQPDLPVSRKAAAETIYALMTSMYF